MKDKIKLLAYPLIVAGSFLEIFYVSIRYMKDGISLPICIVIGISLNVFLMLAVYKNRYVLAVLLIVFSILNTSSGQTLSLLKQEADEKQTGNAIAEKQNTRYENQIAQLEKEILEINVRLSGFDTMEAKAQYRNNIKDDEQAIKDKRAEQARLEGLISANGAQEMKESAETVNATSIYTFYGSIPRWKASDWFTFALHTILSFFVSIMAPFGILVLEKEKESVTPSMPAGKLTPSEWVRLVWRGVEIKKPYVPSLAVMEAYCKIMNYPWDSEAKNLHEICLKKCMDSKLFTAENKIVGTKEQGYRAVE